MSQIKSAVLAIPKINRKMLGILVDKVKGPIAVTPRAYDFNDVLWRFLQFSLCRKSVNDEKTRQFVGVMGDIAVKSIISSYFNEMFGFEVAQNKNYQTTLRVR